MKKVITKQEYLNKLKRVGAQLSELDETIDAHRTGTHTSMRLTCDCHRKIDIRKMHQCLYCCEWYCKPCAEKHFGKTVDQWRQENPNPIEF